MRQAANPPQHPSSWGFDGQRLLQGHERFADVVVRELDVRLRDQREGEPRIDFDRPCDVLRGIRQGMVLQGGESQRRVNLGRPAD